MSGNTHDEDFSAYKPFDMGADTTEDEEMSPAAGSSPKKAWRQTVKGFFKRRAPKNSEPQSDESTPATGSVFSRIRSMFRAQAYAFGAKWNERTQTLFENKLAPHDRSVVARQEWIQMSDDVMFVDLSRLSAPIMAERHAEITGSLKRLGIKHSFDTESCALVVGEKGNASEVAKIVDCIEQTRAADNAERLMAPAHPITPPQLEAMRRIDWQALHGTKNKVYIDLPLEGASKITGMKDDVMAVANTLGLTFKQETTTTQGAFGQSVPKTRWLLIAPKGVNPSAILEEVREGRWASGTRNTLYNNTMAGAKRPTSSASPTSRNTLSMS